IDMADLLKKRNQTTQNRPPTRGVESSTDLGGQRGPASDDRRREQSHRHDHRVLHCFHPPLVPQQSLHLGLHGSPPAAIASRSRTRPRRAPTPPINSAYTPWLGPRSCVPCGGAGVTHRPIRSFPPSCFQPCPRSHIVCVTVTKYDR